MPNKFADTELALSQLLNLPLLSIGRAHCLIWIHFGEWLIQPDRHGGTRTVGTWALHIECPWRLTNKYGIVTGAGDRWLPPNLSEDSDEWDYEFDPNTERTQLDLKMQQFASQNKGVRIKCVQTDNTGGFRLSFEHGTELEVFPTNSQDVDFWRLFQPGNETEHFVVTGTGASGPSLVKEDEVRQHSKEILRNESPTP